MFSNIFFSFLARRIHLIFLTFLVVIATNFGVLIVILVFTLGLLVHILASALILRDLLRDAPDDLLVVFLSTFLLCHLLVLTIVM